MEEVISWTETLQPPTQTLWKLDQNVWPGLQERETANVVEKAQGPGHSREAKDFCMQIQEKKKNKASQPGFLGERTLSHQIKK